MNFALFCKSFGGDVERFASLCRSVRQHNKAGLPFIVSVPDHDRALFRRRFGGDDLMLLSDEDVLGSSSSTALKASRRLSGWRIQQLVKLHFARLELADAWLVVDSDFYFIRDFSANDFIDPAGRVAFITSRTLHRYEGHASDVARFLRDPQAEDGADPWGRRPASVSAAQTAVRDASIPVSKAGRRPQFPWWLRLTDMLLRPSALRRVERPQRIFGRQGPYLNFMPGPIWTGDSLRTLREDYLEPNGRDFGDLIRLCPWESVWVGEWELFRGLPQRFLRAPCFLHFESDTGMAEAKRAGFRIEDFAVRYLGLALAARHQDLLEYSSE